MVQMKGQKFELCSKSELNTSKVFPFLLGNNNSNWVKHWVKGGYHYYHNLQSQDGVWEEPQGFVQNSIQLSREEIQVRCPLVFSSPPGPRSVVYQRMREQIRNSFLPGTIILMLEPSWLAQMYLVINRSVQCIREYLIISTILKVRDKCSRISQNLLHLASILNMSTKMNV